MAQGQLLVVDAMPQIHLHLQVRLKRSSCQGIRLVAVAPLLLGRYMATSALRGNSSPLS